MLFHQVFRQGKLEANIKQNYIYKTKFHCSPRTKNQIISVKPSFTVRPARRIHLTPLGGCIPLRSEGAFHSARRVHLTPLGGCTSLRSEGALHSARRVHFTPLGGYIPLCWEDVARPARSDAPMLFHQVFRQGKLEANRKQNYIYKTKFYCPPCSEDAARPARSVLLVLLGAYRSPCSEGTSHSVRMVHLTPLGGCISLRSEGAARYARSVPLVLLGGCRSKSHNVCKYHKIRKVFQEYRGQIPCRNWGLFCRIRC